MCWTLWFSNHLVTDMQLLDFLIAIQQDMVRTFFWSCFRATWFFFWSFFRATWFFFRSFLIRSQFCIFIRDIHFWIRVMECTGGLCRFQNSILYRNSWAKAWRGWPWIFCNTSSFLMNFEKLYQIGTMIRLNYKWHKDPPKNITNRLRRTDMDTNNTEPGNSK